MFVWGGFVLVLCNKLKGFTPWGGRSFGFGGHSFRGKPGWGDLKHPCPGVVVWLCWWVQCGWLVWFCYLYSFGKACPFSGSVLSGQCRVQSLSLKPLREESCSTFLHGKQPWNCFWRLFMFLLQTRGNAAFTVGYFVGWCVCLLHIHKFGEGLSCFVFRQLGWPVTCWNWMIKLCEFSCTSTAVWNTQDFPVMVWWCICRAELCDCGFSRSLQKARAPLRQAQFINEKEYNLLACR